MSSKNTFTLHLHQKALPSSAIAKSAIYFQDLQKEDLLMNSGKFHTVIWTWFWKNRGLSINQTLVLQ